MNDPDQPSLFGEADDDGARAPGDGAALPEGFRYQPNLISADEQRQLVAEIERLPFQEFQFHGFTGKRRVVSFGWRYDFNERDLRKADDMPPFLLPLRRAAA